MVPVRFVCSLHGSYFSSLLALHLFFLWRHVKIAVSSEYPVLGPL